MGVKRAAKHYETLPADDRAEMDAWIAQAANQDGSIDPDSEFVWRGVAVGFFLGRGHPPAEARRLADLADRCCLV